MDLEYEILEDTHESSVYQGNELIALFFDRTGNTNGVDRAKRFVAREKYLDKLANSLSEYERRMVDDE